MKKRVLSLLLALVMLLGALPMTAFAEETADDVLDVTDDVLDVIADDVLDVTAEVNAPGRPGGEINVQITKGETANCTVYYSENGGDLQLFENIDKTADLPYGIVFFVAPNEGYALSSIEQTDVTPGYNPYGKFYSIVDAADVTNTSFYTSENAATLVGNSSFTDEKLQELVSAAIEKGCEAAFIYTRTTGNQDGIKATLDFYAE